MHPKNPELQETKPFSTGEKMDAADNILYSLQRHRLKPMEGTAIDNSTYSIITRPLSSLFQRIEIPSDRQNIEPPIINPQQVWNQVTGSETLLTEGKVIQLKLQHPPNSNCEFTYNAYYNDRSEKPFYLEVEMHDNRSGEQAHFQFATTSAV